MREMVEMNEIGGFVLEHSGQQHAKMLLENADTGHDAAKLGSWQQYSKMELLQ